MYPTHNIGFILSIRLKKKSVARILSFFTFIIFVFTYTSFAQTGWKKLANKALSSPLNNNLFSCLSQSNDRRTIYAGIDSGLIKFDGYTWEYVGNIFARNGDKRVVSIAINPINNDIYVAGNFTNANGVFYVAKWDGNSWTEVGTLNPNSLITSLACDYNGNVYAAGYFTNGSGHRYVAKWNGSVWSEVGALQANSNIFTLRADVNGNIYTAGAFTNANGFYYIAKWNGSVWSEVGPGLLNANSTINDITIDDSGNLYAVGGFKNALGKRYVAQWNGSVWSELGIGANALNANDVINVITIGHNQNIYIAGNFSNVSGKRYVAKWNGNTWTELSGTNQLNANNPIKAISTDAANKIYAAGLFSNPNGVKYVASFDSIVNRWDTAGCLLMPIDGSDQFVIGKNGHAFIEHCTNLPPTAGTGIKEWTGFGWQNIGTSFPIININSVCGSNISIDSSLENIYVTGTYLSTPDSTSIAKWDGSTWSLIAKTPLSNGPISGKLLIDKAGNFYTLATRQSDGHRFVRKWDGTSWTEIGDGTNLPQNFNILMDHHGHIYVYGYNNLQSIMSISKWNGSSWDQLPNNFDISSYPIYDYTFDYDDNLYLGHADNGQVRIWKYDGSAWTTVGDPNYFSISQYFIVLTCDKYNNIYATGSTLQVFNGIHKWDGNAWKPVGASSMIWEPVLSDIYHLTFDDERETLYANGEITESGNGSFIAYYSGLTALCPPAGSTTLESDMTGNTYQWQLNTGTGFSNIANNSTYSGVNTQSLHINNISSSAYKNEYRCIVDGGVSFTFRLKFTDTWLGNSSTAWEDPNNWSCGTIPDANTDVFFNAGHAIVSSSTAIGTLSCSGNNTSIQLNPGVILTITH